MEGYGIVSACFGMFGFIFALGALAKVTKLESQLREAGVLDGGAVVPPVKAEDSTS